MTQAGWYPDPAGQPQTYRYWDGTSWSQETTGNPYAPPPVPPRSTPPPPSPPPTAPPNPLPTPGAPGYGQVPHQPQPLPYGGFPPAPQPGGPRTGLVIALVVGAVLLLAGLSVAGFVGYRALSDDDDDTDASDDGTSAVDTTDATDDTPTAPSTGPSDTTDSTTGPTAPTPQQCTGGQPEPSSPPPSDATQVSGGGLTIPVSRGYVPEPLYSPAFAFADDFIATQKEIATGDSYNWVSVYGVGGLHRANGFDDPAQAAEVVMACMSQSQELYQGFSGRADLDSGEITVDGSEGFQLTSELRVDDPDIPVDGDVAQVIVVDTGDPETFGLYISVVPIGNDKLIRQQEDFVGQIGVG